MSATATSSPLQADIDIGDFVTEAGDILPAARLRCRIYGDPKQGRSSGWILIFHALTGSQDVHTWWGPLLGAGKPLDTSRYPVIAANLLGSCYGSTGPVSGRPFPALTPGDLARAHGSLLEALDIDRVVLATGGSLGGMVALHWARVATVPTERVVVFAAPAATSAQAIGWNVAQRMAIESDPAWREGGRGVNRPASGMATARAIAMITYRSSEEFSQRFGRRSGGNSESFHIEQYLRRQGEKLVERFDPLSYHALSQIMDRHDLGDPATAAPAITERVESLIGVGIDSDILYPAAEVRRWVTDLGRLGVPTEYREIASLHGHDGFLIELDQVGTILKGVA